MEKKNTFVCDKETGNQLYISESGKKYFISIAWPLNKQHFYTDHYPKNFYPNAMTCEAFCDEARIHIFETKYAGGYPGYCVDQYAFTIEDAYGFLKGNMAVMREFFVKIAQHEMNKQIQYEATKLSSSDKNTLL